MTIVRVGFEGGGCLALSYRTLRDARKWLTMLGMPVIGISVLFVNRPVCRALAAERALEAYRRLGLGSVQGSEVKDEDRQRPRMGNQAN